MHLRREHFRWVFSCSQFRSQGVNGCSKLRVGKVSTSVLTSVQPGNVVSSLLSFSTLHLEKLLSLASEEESVLGCLMFKQQIQRWDSSVSLIGEAAEQQ